MIAFLREAFGCCFEPAEDDDGDVGTMSGIGFAREDLFGPFNKELNVVPYKRQIAELRSLLLSMLPFVPAFFSNPTATTHNCEQLAAALDVLIQDMMPHLTSSERPSVIVGCLPSLENRESQEFVAELQRLLAEVVRTREIDRTGQGITIFVAQLFASDDAEPLPSTNVKMRNDGYALLNEMRTWMACDKDRGGAVSDAEIALFFEHLNAGFSKLGRQRTLRIFDDSGNGALEWSEYHKLYMMLTTLVPLKETFLQLLGDDDDEFVHESMRARSMPSSSSSGPMFLKSSSGSNFDPAFGAAVAGAASAHSFSQHRGSKGGNNAAAAAAAEAMSGVATDFGSLAAGTFGALRYRHRSALKSAIVGQHLGHRDGSGPPAAKRESGSSSSSSSSSSSDPMSMLMGGLNDLDHLRQTKVVQRHREEALASRESIKRFMRERQQERSEMQIKLVFDMMGPPHPPPSFFGSMSGSGMDRASRHEGYTFTQLQGYLTSHIANGWRNPNDVTFHQSMQQPLTHYFINSSHNTYLNGKQFFDFQSLEMYDLALREGARCVEIDCWNGNDGEPMVTHGHAGIFNEITFRAVIETVNRAAFLTSPYPVILSLEVHTNEEQQTKMAHIMEEVFGDRLVRAAAAENITSLFDPSYTPEALKHKILVKGKYKAVRRAAQSSAANAAPVASDGYALYDNSNSNDVSSSLPPVFEIVDFEGAAASAAAATLGVGASGFDARDPYFASETAAAREARERMIESMVVESQKNAVHNHNRSSTSSSSTTSLSKRLKDIEGVNNNAAAAIDAEQQQQQQRLIAVASAEKKLAMMAANGDARYPSVEMAMAADREGEDDAGSAASPVSVGNESFSFGVDGDEEDDGDEETNQRQQLSDNGKKISSKKQKSNNNITSSSSSSSRSKDGTSKKSGGDSTNIGTTAASAAGGGGHKVAAALSAVTFIRATPFKIEQLAGSASKAFPVVGVSSKSEVVPAKWITKDNDVISRLRELSTRFHYRIYPAFFRTESSNYDPMPGWLVGSQMVALNFQTNDQPMRVNRERFMTNGNCGYVLKPAFLRGGVDLLRQSKTLSDFYGKTTLTIKVMCGLLLPRPPALPKETKMQPVCVVILHGTYEEPVAPHLQQPHQERSPSPAHHQHHQHHDVGNNGASLSSPLVERSKASSAVSLTLLRDTTGNSNSKLGARTKSATGGAFSDSLTNQATTTTHDVGTDQHDDFLHPGSGGSKLVAAASAATTNKSYRRRVSPTEFWQYTEPSDNGLVPEWNTTFTFISTSPQVAMMSVYVYHSTVFSEWNFAGGSSCPLLALQMGVRAVPIVPARTMSDPAGRFDPLPPPTCVMVDMSMAHEPLKMGKGAIKVQHTDL